MEAQPTTATAMMIDQRERGIEAYRKSEPFRRRIDLILARALQEHGPIDPERADRAVHDVAKDALVMMLQAIYEDDGEIKNLKAERDAIMTAWEKTVRLQPPMFFIPAPPGPSVG